MRSCVARQEPYIPGALSILQGTVPGRVRGSGHMVPTYFRRELRDRVLQRPLRLRTIFVVGEFASQVRRGIVVILRHGGVSSTPRLRSFITNGSGIPDHLLEPVIGLAEGETRWRVTATEM